MDEPRPSGFPEYGAGGDTAGARRMRRSFRLCVAGCVALAGILWLSEEYLSSSLTEAQYVMALTLPTESARAVLREVVRRDAREHPTPTPKYLAALAEREEADLILARYEEARKFDPDNASLALRYGCRLALAGQCREALECFQTAAARPPKNDLVGYLEAAALGCASDDQEGLSGSLALVARTNSSGNPVLFPEPVWSSALPADGLWYCKLRRQIVDECCAPLYRYADRVLGQAKHQIALGQIQSWDSWLETLERMGERLVRDDGLGSVQATAGLRIRLGAIEQREALARTEASGRGGEAVHPELAQRQARAASALDVLNTFEDGRDARIAADRGRYLLPLAFCWKSLALAMLCYVLLYIASRVVRARDGAAAAAAWALPHSRTGNAALVAGGMAFLALLTALAAFQTLAPPASGGTPVPDRLATVFWCIMLFLMLGYGVMYPVRRLPSAREAAGRRGAEDGETLQQARRARVIAGVVFARRYYGVLTGLLLCAVSAWAIGYRICLSLYPWQVELLTTGLAKQEAEVVRQALALLN